ncbi:glycerol-3-phosphate 1-O-acyltransferase PlsY [Candidatus Sumerlaeota bacterium]|nr:glycerol-3-phosphate 1-O-acyltransferase PlsY [Candidatus Sumerlaeota bacterium]
MLTFIIALGVAYLVGSIPFGYLLGKWLKGVDLRRVGSGNPGASNAFRVLGKEFGVAVFILDALKGFVPARFFIELFSVHIEQLHHTDIALLIGLGAIAGHIFSLFLNFRGGKGVATSIGVYLAIAPLPLIIALAVTLPIIIVSRFVSLGSLCGAVLLPILIKLLQPEAHLLFGVSAILGLVVIYRHRDNIKRLLQGKESRLF